MHKRFDHKAIEKKWQENWKESGLYNVGKRDESKEKEYVLVEWPYPSGNLHIGHWYAFAVPDIYVRYKRMLGKQVLYPMGFDAFGLPAENAAIKHGVNPREWTEKNITHMKNQLTSMGNAFSWDKTTSSIDPQYYKWTQWMFAEFFKNNIAYRGEGVVNWCPHDHTVIANEQVLGDGTCERCGTQIEKKRMPQWMLRITDFADELIDDLDALDWPEHIKEAQRQWIGRSSGAKFDFKLQGITGQEDDKHSVTVFTTRPDTLYGVTFLAISPELAARWLEVGWQASLEIKEFIASELKLRSKRDFKEDTTKRGVDTGLIAINPVSGEGVPVWVVNYVLGEVGTGAIMAVPAHDERDYQFAVQFGLPITQVVSGDDTLPYTGNGSLVNSGNLNGTDSEAAKPLMLEKAAGEVAKTYRLRDWSIGRQRYWGVPIPIVYDPEGKPQAIPEEHLPWILPEDVDFTPTGEPPLAKSTELKERTERIFGIGWTPEVETMDTFVDSSWYFLRYIDNHNGTSLSSKQAQDDWMQVDTYFGGAEHTTMHLLYSRFWQKALQKLNLAIHSEPYKKRINRGLIIGPDGNKMSKSKGNVIDPDEQVQLVGADTVKMYLAFMGPYQGANYPWDLGGIAGIRRFLERVNGLPEHIGPTDSPASLTLLHKTIKKVGEDIAEFKFNTAISAMMIFVNHAEKEGLSRESFNLFLQILAPFAPHLTEELWHNLGNSESIHAQKFPMYDEKLTKDATVTLGVQINGKMRGDITISADASEVEAVTSAKSNPILQGRLDGKEIQKVIYVPGRILNLILKE